MKKALLAQMQTQIAIKETLETQKADEYEKQNIILDTVIKEKVEEAIENDKLPLKIVIEDISEEEKNAKNEKAQDEKNKIEKIKKETTSKEEKKK